MSKLADQIRRSREIHVPVGRWVFIARRPTTLELAQWAKLDGVETIRAIFRACVTGWSGVTEADLMNGGGDFPVDFDIEAFMVWADDQFEVCVSIRDAVFASANDWQRRREESAKN